MIAALTEIVRRRPKLDFASARAERWSTYAVGVEGMLNVFSYFLPVGESFFISSVRNYLDEIDDPVLKDQAERFIFQESMHARLHGACNRRLDAFYPFGQEISRITAKILNWTRRFTPRASQLATSCSIEHFTALMAEGLLRNQRRAIEQFDPEFGALWLWHAVEESEHKAVCFDIYQRFCGRGPLAYLLRVGNMAVTTLVFLTVIGLSFARITATNRRATGDQAAAPAPKLRALLDYVPLRAYLAYYSPSFHPWQSDTRPLIDEWKRNFPEFGLKNPA